MPLKKIIGEYGLVIKLDVSNLENSVDWYQSKLGFILDPRYSTSDWAQLNLPDFRQTAIGLHFDPARTGTKGESTTIVVDDLETARSGLIERGVDVGPIEEISNGVKLAFFADPDGNSFALRQNHPSQPRAVEIGLG